jgi:hypothetical protein
MSAKVSPLRVPTPGTFLGDFRIKRFNIGNEADRVEYESIRTRANNSQSGIIVENIRDQIETEETSDAEGNRTRIDRWYIVVSWWEKKEAAKKPKNPPESENGFYIERTAQSGESDD